MGEVHARYTSPSSRDLWQLVSLNHNQHFANGSDIFSFHIPNRDILQDIPVEDA